MGLLTQISAFRVLSDNGEATSDSQCFPGSALLAGDPEVRLWDKIGEVSIYVGGYECIYI